MSGPPWWLAYAWAASLWVAAGCVGMAVVAAVCDWVTATCARERILWPLSRPRSPIATPSQERPQIEPQGRRSAPQPQPEPQTRTNHTDMETR